MIKDAEDKDGEVFSRCETDEDYKKFCEEAQYPYNEMEAKQVLNRWISLIGNHIHFFAGNEEELTPVDE